MLGVAGGGRGGGGGDAASGQNEATGEEMFGQVTRSSRLSEGTAAFNLGVGRALLAAPAKSTALMMSAAAVHHAVLWSGDVRLAPVLSWPWALAVLVDSSIGSDSIFRSAPILATCASLVALISGFSVLHKVRAEVVILAVTGAAFGKDICGACQTYPLEPGQSGVLRPLAKLPPPPQCAGDDDSAHALVDVHEGVMSMFSRTHNLQTLRTALTDGGSLGLLW